MTAPSLSFVSKLDSPARCPGCRGTMGRGQELQYASKRWPFDQVYVPPLHDLTLWHVSCVQSTLKAATCPLCHQIEQLSGACLL